MGVPHIYGFLTSSAKDRENPIVPKLVTLVLTVGAVAGLVEWLMLKSVGMA